MSLNYRPDIDGLRGLAIISVILFHAELAIFSGGYIGVDVFFVISGFLISQILLKDFQARHFSLTRFYVRRIRRIFPALFTVLLVSSAVALWLLFPVELKAYGKSLLAATLFVSNYYFMFDSGYFTYPAETKPLMHLWSLAVEEQFYIVFPLYLYLLQRFFKRRLGVITLLMLIASLLYSVLMINSVPMDTFYSAPARAWELLLGCVLAIYPKKSPFNSALANVLTIVGVSAIVYATLFYNNRTIFPGLTALLPVVGSALIIYAADSDRNLVGWLLGSKLFRYTGLLSYSLYLWHWPVFVFYKMYAVRELSDTESMLLIVVTFVFSALSWKFIEQPFRQRRRLKPQKVVFLTAAGVMYGSAFFAVVLVVGQGFPDRYSHRINKILAVANDDPKRNFCERMSANADKALKVCYLGDFKQAKASFAVWGDSHGEAILPAINLSAKRLSHKGVFVGKGGCLSLLGAYQARQGFEGCIDNANVFMRYLSAHPEINTVILASRWAVYAMGESFKNEKGYTVYIKDSDTEAISLAENKRVFSRAMQRTLEKLSSLGLQIVFVGQVPETEWIIPVATARAKQLAHQLEFRPKFADYWERQNFVMDVIRQNRQRYALKVVQPYKALCDEDYCRVYENGIPMYRDSNHLSRTHANKLSPLFDSIFQL